MMPLVIRPPYRHPGFAPSAIRGSDPQMTRKADRRAAILQRLADHMLEHGLAASSLRPLARAVGTSDRMLLYYFADKDELFAATLEVVAARLVALLSASAGPPLPYAPLLARLGTLLLDDTLWPFMRLWLELASRAAGGDALARRVGEQLGRGFLVWVEAQLASGDQGQAARLMAIVEGMVVLKSLGLDDIAADASSAG